MGLISYRIAKRYIDFAKQKYRAVQAAYRQIDVVSEVPARDDEGIVPYGGDLADDLMSYCSDGERKETKEG